MLLKTNAGSRLLIGALFFFFYYIIFGFTSLVSGLIHDRMMFALPFESNIPYIPAWSLVYLSINILLILSVFIVKEWITLAAFAVTLLIETTAAGFCFIIFPAKLSYLHSDISSSFSVWINLAKFFSMNNNYFPSLHTAFSFTAAIVYAAYCSRLMKILFYLWACAIAVSTLCIHEHHIADLVAGCCLSFWACRYILPVVEIKLPTYLSIIKRRMVSENRVT